LMRKSLFALFLALFIFACGNTQSNTSPTGVLVTAGSGQATVSWYPVAGASSYNVYYNTVSTFGTASTDTKSVTGILTTSTTVLNLTDGVTYYFVVTSVTGSGESIFSPIVSAIPSPVPTNVLITPAGIGGVTLSWTAVSGATYYSIYYGTSNPVVLAASQNVQGISATSYTLTGLNSGTTYYFLVTATSPPSAQVSTVVQ